MPGKLRPVLQDAVRVEQQVARCAALASTVSSRVVELDRVRSRAREAAARVDDVREAAKCAKEVREALQKGDLETAARSVGRYRQIQGT